MRQLYDLALSHSVSLVLAFLPATVEPCSHNVCRLPQVGGLESVLLRRRCVLRDPGSAKTLVGKYALSPGHIHEVCTSSMLETLFLLIGN